MFPGADEAGRLSGAGGAGPRGVPRITRPPVAGGATGVGGWAVRWLLWSTKGCV